MFFLGQFYHTLDEKGRLTVPARFRELLTSEGGFIMRGFDNNLMVVLTRTFEAMSHRLNQMSMTDPTVRSLKRFLFSGADRVDVDRAGRILITQYLRQVASLESDVVIVGSGHYFEIWSLENWTEQDKDLSDPQSNAQRYAVLNLTFE
ncbi:MAG: division/cell wall cluster transcriptional repressor MraZ [Anaerolineales bacterium]|nr:division/cell wall cluster transcriptional repressor MraZ [Anaerolineales bacterium]